MSNNRKALLRYRVLDKCFADRRHRYYIDDLMEKVNDALEDAAMLPVSKRQIYADIDFMKSSDGWDAPIESRQDGKRKYITYSRNFSIMETPITEMEMEQLETLITSLSRLQALPTEGWVNDLLGNLRSRFGMGSENANLVGFEQNRDMQGLRFLSDLINHTINRQPITIDYHPFGKETKQWIIHPYYLKQYNNRWFLLGYNPEFDDLSIVALDRIENLATVDKLFIENKYINFDNYFRNIIGISLQENNEVEQVLLKFTPERLPYVLSKPIHHSQMIEDRKQGIISIRVIPNKELISELIWFGSDVEVLSPDTLRDQIKEKIAEMYKNYFPVKHNFTTRL